ncbi:uncharacterized protein SCDLUD_005231 [Saccharomycodes ludwigii]|uniref:uncharacterized protein n=1 Tax=Saccharomycodes ludwigii TaxID=36035 RepID=UPI001E8A30C5|nr:hypothetical protein SCDLUD_005231 [Saccharomycodes ludwigii]KAH3898890.1 hypothetical protein SCDLUD_005231 [Saccharomycodes ludwigii]
MPIQLFGSDQIIIHYENTDATNDNVSHNNSDSTNITIKEKLTYKFYYYLSKFKHRLDTIHFNVPVIYGASIVHWLILTIWGSLLVSSFLFWYKNVYNKSALLANMLTNFLLFGISDALAQIIYSRTLYISASRFANGDNYNRPASDYSTHNDMDDLHLEPLRTVESIRPVISENVNDNNSCYRSQFDFHRWVCFTFWGWFLSFFQCPWYKFLNFLYTDDPSVVQVFERVLSDQLVYSPVSLYSFFCYSNYIMEHGNDDTFKEKIKDIYVSTLGANYAVWPAVQLINFSFIPRQFQIVFSSSVGVLWNCFLSMRNASQARKI